MHKKNKIPSVVFVGGIEEGKTSLINSLWNNSENSTESNKFVVEDDIPGRGKFSFSVEELPAVLYSLQNDWFKNEENMTSINNADVLVFVLPAASLGYKTEMNFIKRIVSSAYYHGQYIVISLSKCDYLFFEEENEKVELESVSTLVKNISSIFLSLAKDISIDKFDPSSIVPTSAANDWNFNQLKEKVWEGIIEKTNDSIFDTSIPTLVIAGKRGCGKSSTLNNLWGLELPTNKSVACTKYPMVIRIETLYNNNKVYFNIVDLPGIAESLEADMQYTQFYEKYIKSAKLLICLSQADTRAYLQDQVFYTNLINSGIITKETNILLGMNQADLLFKSKENLSGIDLNTITDNAPLIKEKVADYFQNVYGNIFKGFPNIKEDNVCVFSVLQNWNMEKLRSSIYNKLF